jgi:hypothetical protein
MKTIRVFVVFLLALTTSLAALQAYAGGGYRGGGGHHHHKGGTRWVVGVNVGFPGYWGGYWGGWPWYGPAYYPYPYYYPYAYPAPVVVQQQPTTYIEQPAPQPQQPAQSAVGYWYYCTDPGAYYPYVKECPAGWQRVAPQPSN